MEENDEKIYLKKPVIVLRQKVSELTPEVDK